jgi:SOS-response transcriptional repressor LexA
VTPLVQNIIELRKRLRETQDAFAARFEVEQPTVSRWERGVNEPGDEQIGRMATLAGLPLATFRYGHQSVVPLISWASAALLADPVDLAAVLEPDRPHVPIAGLSTGEYFALMVESDLMDRIAPQGSLVIVDRRDRDPVVGKSYIVRVEQEATFKRFRSNPPRFEAYSSNPDHETLFPDEGTRIVGRACKILMDV